MFVRSKRSEQLLEDKMKMVMAEFGYKGGDVSLVCKCGTPREANEKARNAGLGSRWFLPECCEELQGDEGLNLASLVETDLAVCADGQNYIAVDSDIRDLLLR